VNAPTDSQRWMPLLPAGLGLVLVVLGGVFGGIGQHQRTRGEAVKTWPEVEATITAASFSPFRRSGETQDELNEVTSFHYVVEGRSYDFTSTEYIGWASDGHGALRRTAGQKLPLYFNPQDPSDTVLSRTGEGPLVIFVLIAGLCALLSLPFWFFAVKLQLRNLRRS
jgi:hypothetical protein